MSCRHRAIDFIKARRSAGLSDETMSILLLLGESATGVSRTDVSRSCGINPTTLPRYLSRLVQSGHVVKLGKEGDRREVLFGLSPHGIRLVDSLCKSFSPDHAI